MDQQDTFSLVTRLLPECIYRKYGYDFRDYSEARILRRSRTIPVISLPLTAYQQVLCIAVTERGQNYPQIRTPITVFHYPTRNPWSQSTTL